MYYTYVLISEKDNKLYVGYTQNLEKRFAEHSNGKVKSTRMRRPLNLIYYEACRNKVTSKKVLPKYPDVEWKRVIGIRDIITHHYSDLVNKSK